MVGLRRRICIAATVAATPIVLATVAIEPAWAADDSSHVPLPSPPSVTVRVHDPDAAAASRPGREDRKGGNQADQLDDFEHYAELMRASRDLESYLDNLDYGASNGTGALVLPAIGPTTSPFGERVHPIFRYVRMHTGLDFKSADGVIYAADAGTVVEATWSDAYGNFVVIDHGLVDGHRLTTMYAHQPDLRVVVGQRIAKGQPIGKVGSTGFSTGPHLHFEVRLDGAPTNPAEWLPPPVDITLP